MKRLKEQLILKGLRPGKVPKEVLKRQFGKAVFGEVLDKCFKRNFYKSIRRKQN